MWKICDVQPFLLLPTMLDLRLLFRKLFMVGPYLLSLLDAGIALQGLITQVHDGLQGQDCEACGHFEVRQTGAHSEVRSGKVREIDSREVYFSGQMSVENL